MKREPNIPLDNIKRIFVESPWLNGQHGGSFVYKVASFVCIFFYLADLTFGMVD